MDSLIDMKPQGAFSALLADQELTHLELVLRRSLIDDALSPIMPPTYWRDRLALVARSSHLSHTQIQTVHRLYLQIDAYEASNRALDTAPELTPEPMPPMPRAVPQQDLAEAAGKRHS
ncbi:hypothetical protein [Caballeronia mineralivorans]|jgi:hypothetical protein|uniref:hypothetical protein n=1 Tax=Caballeronia mineralivorans TaxID=2010198 RepID=UPI0023F00D69|nr:hypothetical protein [Caballeronia mineralivorans]MDB5789389.1 hypothetical protein [Caballeronia mineralivorans]MEA3103379.1 hypothetical protein [Caballeronia mineralivorans]